MKSIVDRIEVRWCRLRFPAAGHVDFAVERSRPPILSLPLALGLSDWRSALSPVAPNSEFEAGIVVHSRLIEKPVAARDSTLRAALTILAGPTWPVS